MKRDIVAIREAIERVVNLLTLRKVKVTQRGMTAAVLYNRDNSIREVNLPFIPDDATEEFIAAVQGFLDHEVGHVLFTDPEQVTRAFKAGQRVATMANLVEDTFIERKMAESFTGTGVNLNAVRRFHIEKLALPHITKALAEGNTDMAKAYLMPIQMRAWGGQVEMLDLLRDRPDLADLMKDFADAVGEDLIEQIPLVENSEDSTTLATRIVKRMVKWEESKREEARKKAAAAAAKDRKRREKDKPSEGSPSDAGEPGEGPDEDDLAAEGAGGASPSGKPDDAGTEGTEDDDSGKKRPGHDGTGKPGKTADKDGAKGDSGELDPSEADSGESKSSEDESSELDSDELEPGEGDSDELDSDESESSEAESDRVKSSEGESSEDDSTEAESSGPESDEEGEGTDGDAEDEDGTGDDSGDEDGAGGTGDTPEVSKLLDDVKDFDEGVGEALTKEALSHSGEGGYAIFSNEWDLIEPAPESHAAIAKLEGKVGRAASLMTKHLERAVASRSKRGFNPGRLRGRINTPSLFRVATGDERVFRERYERKGKETAVTLLVDCSSSMNAYDRIGTAGATAYALCDALERLRIKCEVIGFTTLRGYSGDPRAVAMRKAMSDEDDAHPDAVFRYGRNEPIYMPIFKSFNERLSTTVKARLASLVDHPNYLNQNPDGECVAIAAHRLRQVPNVERRILFTLSDGEPAAPPGFGLDDHLRKVVKEISRDISVVGIGIQTHAVRHYYPRNVVLNNLNELPTTVIGEISKLLLES